MDDFTRGRQTGTEEANHPSGACAHLRARDRELWDEQTPEFQAGYDEGWKADHPSFHDYEPGEVTAPMQSDPNCRVCGEPKGSYSHR